MKVQIVMPSGAFGAVAGEDEIDTAMRVIGHAFAEKGDWATKYGAEVENDVFMMKRYCWCEKEGECPWCTGCGVYQDRGACRACAIGSAHSPECFQTVLKQRHDEYDHSSGWLEIDAALSAPDVMESLTEEGPFGATVHYTRRTEKGEKLHKQWSGAYDKRRKEHDRLTGMLCKERGLEASPFMWRCDCGAKERGDNARAEGLGCDYHQGSGIFSRFAPWTLDHDTHYYDPPNFWFKPTDFRLTWYKYIGRDMKSRGNLPADFMRQIMATHPKGWTVERAVAEYEREAGERAQSFERMFASLGVATGAASR